MIIKNNLFVGLGFLVLSIAIGCTRGKFQSQIDAEQTYLEHTSRTLVSPQFSSWRRITTKSLYTHEFQVKFDDGENEKVFVKIDPGSKQVLEMYCRDEGMIFKKEPSPGS